MLITYSRQVSRARPNDSGHKTHVGYTHSHTRGLITGLVSSFLRQAGVELTQNDSGHKTHVGYTHSHTRGLITGLVSSFLRQAGVELTQITLFTRPMLAIYTATQGA